MGGGLGATSLYSYFGGFMFETYTFVKYFGILIAVVYLIYRFQLIMTVIDGFKKWRTGKDKFDVDKNKYLKMQAELDNIVASGEVAKLNKSTVKFELLKIISSENQHTIYFSVDGGSIFIKSITSKNIVVSEIKPEGYIPPKSSAHFVFSKSNIENGSIFLEITFEDQFTITHKKNYVLSIQENIFKEIV
ncbi:MAG: hypothetical protein WAU11_00720 [Ignavibacteriaceae bacterium]